MISVNEAVAFIKENIPGLISVRLGVIEACGFISAQDIYSPLALPPFNQSAMDGYAIRFKDIEKNNFRLAGEVAAGGYYTSMIEPNSAIRIFTGASVPEGADTVIMQEHAIVSGGNIAFSPLPAKQGMNVRPIGSHIQKGEIAFAKGQLITPAAVGHLTGLGITEVFVYNKPKVAIITTGDELIEPGLELEEGSIYDSNKPMLVAALASLGIEPIYINHVPDEPEVLYKDIQIAFEKVDMLLVTGGVSVGDYDYVVTMLEKAGVKKVFHNVKQKPGKPLYFGTLGDKLVFGLPGNPASVLTCFYEYVSIALKSMMGYDNAVLKKSFLPLKNSYTKKKGLTHFLKGIADENGVEILSGQESYILHSYALANCLVCIHEDVEEKNAGDIIEIHWIN
ncbi:MAG: molybdopterin molybdotransferase MoeA [Bacteroidota bacterium]|nr:molybdopterin molybdotransferase MoeA [Bacteroidota bacterium]